MSNICQSGYVCEAAVILCTIVSAGGRVTAAIVAGTVTAIGVVGTVVLFIVSFVRFLKFSSD